MPDSLLSGRDPTQNYYNRLMPGASYLGMPKVALPVDPPAAAAPAPAPAPAAAPPSVPTPNGGSFNNTVSPVSGATYGPQAQSPFYWPMGGNRWAALPSFSGEASLGNIYGGGRTNPVWSDPTLAFYKDGGKTVVPRGTFIADDGTPIFRAGEAGPEQVTITPLDAKGKPKKGKKKGAQPSDVPGMPGFYGGVDEMIAGQPQGFIFTGNQNQGGTYSLPNYGSQYNAGPGPGYSVSPQPPASFSQASYGYTNPTYTSSQLTNEFTRNMQQGGPNWTAQGAMTYWNQMQPLYQGVQTGQMPLPQAMTQANQMAFNVPQQHPMTTGTPAVSGPQAAAQPQIRPPNTGDAGLRALPQGSFDQGPSQTDMMGPDGRSFSQITGTPYKSDAEREFYLNQIGKTVDPGTGQPTARGNTASTAEGPPPFANRGSEMVQGAPQTQPQQSAIKPPMPATGSVGPNGRSAQEVAGTPYRSAEERDWYLAQSQGGGAQSGQRNATTPPTPGAGNAFVTGPNGSTGPINGQQIAPIAQKYGIAPEPLARLMNHEGNGAWDTSEKGVQPARWGIVQSTAKSYGISDTRQMTPEQAYDIAGHYIAQGMQQFGDPAKAYAAYFIGPGGVQNAVRAGGQNWVSVANATAAGYGYGSNGMSNFLSYLGLLPR
jgi:hypothetical protein